MNLPPFVKHICILLTWGIISGCSSQQNGKAAHQQTQQASVSEMEWVLSHHQIRASPYTLDEGELPVTESPPAWIFEEATGAREKYHVPSPPQTADAFQYSIALDKASRNYWLIRSGGYGGRQVVFGPGALMPSNR